MRKIAETRAGLLAARWGAVLMLWASGLALYAADRQLRADENEVRAALIYNILKFITPQENAEQPDDEFYHLGVAGGQEILQSFQKIEGKTIQGRKIMIYPITSKGACYDYFHAVYGPPEKIDLVHKASELSANTNVISICEAQNPVEHGCVVSLSRVDQHFSLTVFRGVAAKQNLTISSHLLKMATVIDSASEEGP